LLLNLSCNNQNQAQFNAVVYQSDNNGLREI
jgi:hypothetical protein